MTRALRGWMGGGKLTLASSAASEIVQLLHRLALSLTCPLVIRAVPRDFLETVSPRGCEDCDVIFATAGRMYREIIPQGMETWGPRLARLPWNKEEAQAHLMRRYRSDEANFLGRLETVDSRACGIYAALGLTRDVIKQSMRSLRGARVRQVALSNIICATRFRHYARDGRLLQTLCPVCRQVPDSLEHMLECTGLSLSPGTQKEAVEFLRELAYRACRGNPGFVTPIFHDEEGELELEGEAQSDAGQSSGGLSLSL